MVENMTPTSLSPQLRNEDDTTRDDKISFNKMREARVMEIANQLQEEKNDWSKYSLAKKGGIILWNILAAPLNLSTSIVGIGRPMPFGNIFRYDEPQEKTIQEAIRRFDEEQKAAELHAQTPVSETPSPNEETQNNPNNDAPAPTPPMMTTESALKKALMAKRNGKELPEGLSISASDMQILSSLSQEAAGQIYKQSQKTNSMEALQSYVSEHSHQISDDRKENARPEASNPSPTIAILEGAMDTQVVEPPKPKM